MLNLEMEEQKQKRQKSISSNDGCAWSMILPYLNPAELASISSTCKTLYQISKTITRRRISDVSRGLEKLPIPISLLHSHSQSQSYPYFLYTPTQILPVRPDFRQPWGFQHHHEYDASFPLCRDQEGPPDPFLFRVEGVAGCECATACATDYCPCLECGPSCKCDSSAAAAKCGNRATQGGVSVHLKIVRDERKGWGLYAAELIPNGCFVCEYAGEVLSTKEATERQQTYDKLASIGHLTPALLVVKEHLPSGNTCMRINIDATRLGNIARFINHSCDGGNLDTVIVRSSGALLPRICFFASRDIQENEELTFSYGDVRLKPDGQPCFCGTSSCAGVLPSEHT